MNHLKTVGIIICLCLSTNLSAAGFEKKIEKSFDAGMGGTLDLDSDIGSVTITKDSGKKVTISILLTAAASNQDKAQEIFDDFELSFVNNENNVKIEGDMLNHNLWRNNHLKVRFNITVPKNYNLNIKTGGGKIDVADIQGSVDLKTSGGSIVLGKIDGKVNAKTSGGIMTLEGSTGDAILHTSGGSIRIGKVDGDVEARTSGGNIDADIVQGNLKASTSGGALHFRNVNGNLIGKTSGGPIEALLSAQIREPVELYTSGGNIKLTIPADFKANLAASTFGGHVFTDLPVMVRGKISSSSLNGLMNGGGPEVSLKTMGGNIDIIRNAN